MKASFTGGCQCGAVRYRFAKPGRASICHCRMCQKAMGNYFAPLVEVEGFEWTRGDRAAYASSNVSERGFCSMCGTPLTLETPTENGLVYEIAIGSLDDPAAIEIDYHANVTDRLAVVMRLEEIPEANAEGQRENNVWNSGVISNQHPDHDTDNWTVKGKR